MFYFSLKPSSISSSLLITYSLILLPLTLYFCKTQQVVFIDWTILNINSCYMNMSFLVDFVSLTFSGIVSLISGSVMLFSSSYMKNDVFLKRFIWLVMLFVLSMNFLIFIPSLPALLLGWDGLGIVSFALVIYYQNNKSLGAGMLTLLANRVGDVMILISIGLLVLVGQWNIMMLWDFYLMSILVLVIMLAGMTKSAQIPFSSWLPAAMAAPTPVSALVHSSTLVTAGVFLLIRFYPILCLSSLFKYSLLLISVLTMLMAGIGANFENDLKKIIALSTLSQLGVMMMSLALGSQMLALYHLYTHAMFKALLFLCAGAVIHASENNQDIRNMGMISKQMPLTTVCMNVANLSLCGAPFLSGFYSKDMILEMCLWCPTSYLMIMMIFLATGMTMAYSLRLSFSSLWSSYTGLPLHSKHEMDLYVNISTYILSFAAILMGSLLQSIILQFESETLILTTAQKSMTMLVIAAGLLISLSMWDLTFNSMSNSKFKYFYSSMWFFSYLSTGPIIKFSCLSGTKFLKSLDQGWVEALGGQGMMYTLKWLTNVNQNFQKKTFNTFIMLIFLSILFVFMLASWF
uniref:NADH dehydrogenase subunit 5 n=1 Tax=Pila globosa TaxID=759386 RepID=UPI0025A974A8|nr:NADH dehydrogenase subunit 5 [Pila globosa]WIW42433.1 NADH dehydrogenase subunit 5 [Pila globosa]